MIQRCVLICDKCDNFLLHEIRTTYVIFLTDIGSDALHISKERNAQDMNDPQVLRFKYMIYLIIYNNTSGYFVKWEPDNLQIAESTFLE